MDLHANEQQLVWSYVTGTAQDETTKFKAAIGDLESTSDEDSEALAKKESQWDGILSSAEYPSARNWSPDAWCASFVWPKRPGPLADAARRPMRCGGRIRDGLGAAAGRDGQGSQRAGQISTISFTGTSLLPQVFANGGFGVVLGNLRRGSS